MTGFSNNLRAYPNRVPVTDYSSAEAWLAKGRNPSKRKVAHNTWVTTTTVEGCLGIQYHGTVVVGYFADGTTLLNTGGWHTVTTAARLRWFAPRAHVSTDRGRGWCLWSPDDPRTLSKIQRCRACRGTGKSWHTDHSWEDGRYTRRRVISDYPCWGCKGEGTQDYGNRPIPRIFIDGMMVDHETGTYLGIAQRIPYGMHGSDPAPRRLSPWHAPLPMPRGECDGPDTYDASERWNLIGEEADAAIADWNDFIAGLKIIDRNPTNQWR